MLRIVANGSGLGVATVSPNEAFDGSDGAPGSSDAEESGWRSRAGELGGWGAVALLALACLIGGAPVENAAPVSDVSEWSGDGFELDAIHSRWVDNASNGPLYVISGRIRRAEGASPWDVVPLDVELVDAAGVPIDGTRAAIGPEIPMRYLRESNPDELTALQSNRARQFAAFAGTWLSFDAVVAAVPDGAERFAFSPSQ